MKKQKEKPMKFWEVVLDLSVFGFMASIVVVFTRAFQSYLQDLPLLFELFYIIGVIYFMILTIKINWARKLTK